MKRLSETSAYMAATLLSEVTGDSFKRRSGFAPLVYAEIRAWLAKRPLPPELHQLWLNNIDQEARDALKPGLGEEESL